MPAVAEKFVHRHTTRMLSLLVVALVVGPIGFVLTGATLVVIADDGWVSGFLLVLLVGGMALLFGTYYTVRYFRPLEFVSEVSPEGIVCRLNGRIDQAFRREDIRSIDVSTGPVETIYVTLTSGRRVRVRPRFFTDNRALRDQLRSFDYPLADE